ncbi:unnamed protein product [Brassicogethes aeneus]|uniref:Transcription initiation protein SPT3 homolog n=1 Tax=Brassicogethes aeneus TaxID=1431903 RepID=A0A9P0APN1_BRAAE|nr:unnamed protein product [Brassicogethes aeneus]
MDPKSTQSKVSFYNEISLMMFGFGDSHKPNPETVRLVESITIKQLKLIVQEALKYVQKNVLEGEELLFLMRHNKHKMRRFVQYLHNKETKNMLSQLQSNITDVDGDKPKCKLLKFIEMIDETGEFTDLNEVDEIKFQRQLRADRISQALDEQKYLEFCKARSVSFSSKSTVRNMEKLRLWIDPNNEVVFKPEALDVLSYYAYQTVAEITDYAILVRMDGKFSMDPMQHLTGSYYNATMFNGDFRFINSTGSNPDYSRVYSGQPPISVNEIKEVMRRVYMPQAGKLNFGGKVPETHFLFAL